MALSKPPLPGGVDDLDILVVGLGLMGGSVARALRARTAARVWGVERDATVLAQAQAEGLLDGGADNPAALRVQPDLTVVCLYPEAAAGYLRQHLPTLHAGAVVTDLCGVKAPVIDAVRDALGPDADYVPGHPMAGRERGGFGQSTAALFEGCNYVVTPLPGNRPASVALVERFAGALGAGAIVTADPTEHDEMIAYTSQLPHVLAVGYVLAAGERDPLPFSAGSYRDVSRVAAINAELWTELFLANREPLLGELRGLREQMGQLEQSLEAGDREGLIRALSAAARVKEGQR